MTQAMPQSIHVVSRERHADKRWHRRSGYGFAAQTTLVPVAAAELSHLVRSLPLAFVMSEGKQTLVALFGLVPGRNLFVAPDGRWFGSYVPAALRGYPFRLGRTGEDTFALCVDEGSGLVVDAEETSEGIAFFDDEGKPSTDCQQVVEFLSKSKQSADAAARAVAALDAHGLIEPWPLKIKDGEAERAVNGVGRIAEAKLNGLDDQTFLELRKSGALPVAYAQMLSMGNISLFSTLEQAHAAAAKRAEAEDHTRFLKDEEPDIEIDWDAILKD